MNMKPMTYFCSINMGQSPDSKTYNNDRNGLPFYQGNADFGEIHPHTRVWCSAPVKVANCGDVLVSVRAPIGAVNIAAEVCCIGRGLAALTPNPETCSHEYLYYAIQSRVASLIARGTGSTFKAIGRKVLEETQLPDYTLAEQAQIIDKLACVDRAIAARKQQLALFDQFVKSRFIELFGDPVYNSNGLPTRKLCELGALDRGKSQHRPRNDPKLLNGPYPLIQTGEVASAGLFITEYKNTYSELGLQQSKMWKAGTLCITIAANIAQTAILSFDACFPDSVVGFVPSDEVSAIYMHYWFGFFQKILEEQAPQVAQKNINLKILSDLDVMVPTKEHQEQFAAFVEQTDKSKYYSELSLELCRLAAKIYRQEWMSCLTLNS